MPSSASSLRSCASSGESGFSFVAWALALEGLARDVLGLGPVTDAVRDVGVDAPDQRLGVGERVAVEHLASFLHDGILVG